MSITPINPGTTPKTLFSVLSSSIKTYRVVSPLHHGGLVNGVVVEKRYEIGETIDLDAETAEPLLGHTVVPAN
ncbi:MAG: hypothetical protein A3E25_17875 [Burkholderiales bacterium RIFCSPHIGHO2_12_FULL_69_20]|nr:MAG: hypothetical protein A3E25_17875 [Burkholderiales bacterium RIFCSPHIGHO2_12_FULL_69_20]